jgi:hypothetical protein
MNTNFGIELSDESAQNVGGGYYFGESSNTNVYENLSINKKLYSDTYIKGNFAGAEAKAIAGGPNSATQAVSFTYTGAYGSESNATSVSGTSGFYYQHSY